MPRQARKESGTGIYHVMLRGMDWIFYEELPNMDAGGPIHDGERAMDENNFVETTRVRVCPHEGFYGIQVPKGAWHSIVVHESSTIFEAKDGVYVGK